VFRDFKVVVELKVHKVSKEIAVQLA